MKSISDTLLELWSDESYCFCSIQPNASSKALLSQEPSLREFRGLLIAILYNCFTVKSEPGGGGAFPLHAAEDAYGGTQYGCFRFRIVRMRLRTLRTLLSLGHVSPYLMSYLICLSLRSSSLSYSCFVDIVSFVYFLEIANRTLISVTPCSSSLFFVLCFSPFIFDLVMRSQILM